MTEINFYNLSTVTKKNQHYLQPAIGKSVWVKAEISSGRGSAANFSVIRHIALNMLRHEKSSKVGIKNKRLTVAWDNGYLLKVLEVKKIHAIALSI